MWASPAFLLATIAVLIALSARVADFTCVRSFWLRFAMRSFTSWMRASRFLISTTSVGRPRFFPGLALAVDFLAPFLRPFFGAFLFVFFAVFLAMVKICVGECDVDLSWERLELTLPDRKLRSDVSPMGGIRSGAALTERDLYKDAAKIASDSRVVSVFCLSNSLLGFPVSSRPIET